MSAGNRRNGQQQPIVLLVTIPVILALILGLAGTAFLVRISQTEQTQQQLGQSAPGTGGTSPGIGSKGPGLASSPLPSAAVTPQVDPCSAALKFSATSVQVGLARTFTPGPAVSFGLPLPSGALTDLSALRVTANGAPVAATTKQLLAGYDPAGAPKGIRSVLVQLPASVLQGDCTAVEVSWQGGTAAAPAGGPGLQPYVAVSVETQELVQTATRTIERRNGVATLVETKREQRSLFTAREPAVLATFPAGYLGTTGILGPQVAASQIGPDLAGLKFITDQITPFGLSGMYQESYALHPDSVIGPNDTDEQKEINGYEGWLYDRCATYLLFATTTGDTRFLREGMRSCSYYASKIALNGENRGFLSVTPEPDDKYSHLRGLYAYYALTGDEAALAAGEAIAEMWMRDPLVIAPYREGRLRGPDRLWTERQLGVGLEGIYYGHLLTGDVAYLRATQELITTAHRHITGDAAALAAINPDSPPFPPQNCLIHNAEQASEGNPDQPWCSGWMQILMIDALLAYQGQTNDPRIDEMFVRLTRFLRDVGTAYFRGDVLQDDFLHPSVAYDERQDLIDRRLLVPLYGSGIDDKGKRQNFGEYDDFQHCLDVTVLTAVALRALKRTGTYDQNPIGPFKSEGESFLALHHELAFCAYAAFADQTRPARDPAAFPSDSLEEGLRDPAKFILENRIGFPLHNTSPQRKLSWWFNVPLAQFALLKEAGISVTELRPGIIQPTRSTQSPPVQRSLSPLTLANERGIQLGAALLNRQSSGDRRRLVGRTRVGR
jgi:hypothetical protein